MSSSQSLLVPPLAPGGGRYIGETGIPRNEGSLDGENGRRSLRFARLNKPTADGQVRTTQRSSLSTSTSSRRSSSEWRYSTQFELASPMGSGPGDGPRRRKQTAKLCFKQIVSCGVDGRNLRTSPSPSRSRFPISIQSNNTVRSQIRHRFGRELTAGINNDTNEIITTTETTSRNCFD
jgi:hypothetical protein